MVSPTRITISMNDVAIERLKDVSAKLDISQARLVSCLLAQSDDEIADAVVAHYSTLFPSKGDKKEKEKALLALVKDMNPDELAALLQARAS